MTLLSTLRSQAFKIKEWKKYLSQNSIGFHFDSSNESILGIYQKMNYIKEKEIKIKNALIIIDEDTLYRVKNNEGHLFISHPELSKESYKDYYLTMLKAHLDIKFLISFLDYKLFKTYRNYMENYFIVSKYSASSDNVTGDIYYGNDQMIEENEKDYYDNLIKKKVFFDRTKQKITKKEITNEEEELLNKIKSLLVVNNTNYKIVISPLYNQIEFDKERFEYLVKIFGKNNVYDFSGKNEFTESIYNYYEDSHYRPQVANKILEKIYK